MEAIQSTQSSLDDKLADFKAQVCQSQEEAAAKAVKRSKAAEKPYVFKKKGNEAQAKFNSEVQDSVNDALGELEGESRPSKAVTEAKAALEQGLKKLAERQKLIKLADRSEFGWGVVAEYTADELADGSDDEKKIEKAEKAAEKKAAKRKRAASSRVTVPAKLERLPVSHSQSTFCSPGTQTSWFDPGGCQSSPVGALFLLWRDGPYTELLLQERRSRSGIGRLQLRHLYDVTLLPGGINCPFPMKMYSKFNTLSVH